MLPRFGLKEKSRPVRCGNSSEICGRFNVEQKNKDRNPVPAGLFIADAQMDPLTCLPDVLTEQSQPAL
jgi:hypothetical protein